VTRHVAAALALVFVLHPLPACSKSKLECQAEIDGFSEWARAMMRDERRGLFDAVMIPAGFEPELLRLGPGHPEQRVANGYLITITADWIRVWDKPVVVDSVAESEVVARLLAELDEKNMLNPGEEPPIVNLWVTPDAPWRLVVEAVRGAARKGYREVFFHFHPHNYHEAKQPPRAVNTAELERISRIRDMADRSRALTPVFRRLAEQCSALADNWAMIAEADSPDKPSLLIHAALDAAPKCGCRLDLAAVQNALFALLWIQEPFVAIRVPLTGPREEKKKPLKVPGSRTWREAHLVLLEALKKSGGLPLDLQ
jgi:hypothetical protein